MPFITVTLPEGHTKEQKQQFAEAVHQAVVNILGEKGEYIIFNELTSKTGNVADDGKLVE